MKKFLTLVILLLAGALPLRAQFVNVTAIVQDPANQPYRNCSGEADFVPSPTATTVPLLSGSTFQTSVVIASCDSTGAFTLSLADNALVSDGHSGPTASQWRFSICSGTTTPKVCFQATMTITGTNQNITAALQAAAVSLPSSTIVTATNLAGPGSIGGTFSGTPTLTQLWTHSGGLSTTTLIASGLITATTITASGLITANAGITSAGPNTLNGTTVVTSLEGTKYCDNFASLQACHDALPAAGGVMVIPFNTTFTTQVNITKPAITVRCQGSDQNANGTVLTFSPSAPASAFFITNSSRFILDSCYLTQGNAQATVNGLSFQGAQGGALNNSIISGFTGDGYKLADSATASSFYNECNNSRVQNNNIGMELAQSNAGKVVNANLLKNCAIVLNTTMNIKTTGNVSEFVMIGGDISGASTPLVQYGDTVNFCRGGVFIGVTMEGSTVNQVGILNNGCQALFVHSEGGLTDAGSIPVKDVGANASHLYIESGSVNPHGIGWDSTLAPFKFNVSNGCGWGTAAPPASNGCNFPSGFSFQAAGVTTFTVNNTVPNFIAPSLGISATAFASIGTPANGTFLYCNDCTIANPCAGGGTGALAKRLNGVWVCN